MHGRRLARLVLIAGLLILFSVIVLWSPLFARASIVTPMFFMLIPSSFLFISKFKKIRKKPRLKSKFSMLLLLTIVLLVTVSMARLFSGTMFQTKPVRAWWDNNWHYCRKITIDSSKVDEALTDFPVLVYLNSSRIDWTNVQDDLHDLRFVADDNSTVLEYEIENYTVNNEAWLWVKTPSVSNTSDTSFYMFYGNNTCGGGEDAQNVWDSNFVLVQHLNETATGTRYDSTSNNNDGATSGYDGDEAVTGRIDGADDLDGTNDYIDCGNDTSLDITGEIMVEVWIKPSANMSNNAVVAKQNGTNSQIQYDLIIYDDGKTRFQVYDTSYHMAISSSSLSLNNWHHIVGVYDKQNVTVYVDTVETEGDAFTGSIQSTEAIVSIGDYYTYDGTYAFNGTIDEVRISNTSRSAGWIKASYYSGMDTLLTFGPEELGNTAPTIGEFEAPATVYANEYFFLNATIDDQDGVADFVNATVEIGYSVILKWDNATDTFSEQSDTSNYCTLDAGNSVRISVNSTAHKLSWKIKLTWNYTEGTVDVVATNTKVYDDWGDSGSESYSSLFTFEDDLIIHTDANVDDNRVNPSDTVTFTGTIYYEGTATVPEDVTGITAYVELNGVQKGLDSSVTSGGYSISVTAEASVNSHSYNIYATTDQNTATNQTISVIVDRLQVQSYTVSDPRVNINDNVNINVTIWFDYDDTISTTATITINGYSASHQGSGVYRITRTSASVGDETYNNVACSAETTHGITMVDQNGQSQQVIWDQIVAYWEETDEADGRENVDTNVEWHIRAVLDYDDTQLGSGDTLSCSWGALMWDTGNSYFKISHTEPSVTSVTISLTSGNEAGHIITAFSENITETSIQYDRIRIDSIGVVDGRIDVNSEGCFYATASLESDSHTLGAEDSLSLGGHAFTWVAGRSRWEYNVTKSSVQGVTMDSFTSGNEATYGITVGNINGQSGTIIYDRLDVTIFADSNSPTVGTQVNFTVTAIYNYSGTQVTEWTVNTYRNSTHFANGNFSDTQYGEVIYQYTTENVTETTYGLTAFTSNTETISWGGLQIEIYEITIDDGRIDVSTNAYMYFHCRFNVNGSDCTTGTLAVNATNYNINGTGWATVTVSFATVGKRIYTVTGVNVNGETDFQQGPSNPEIIWDRIIAYWEQVNDTRTDINFYVEWRIRAVLDYDDNPLGSSDSLSCSWGSLSWDSDKSWFEITHTEASVTSVTISLSSGSETTYDITAFSENITETTVIFDRVNVTISADGTYVALNTQVNFTVTAIYEFDSNPVTSWIVNIYRNSTHFAAGNFTDTQASSSIYEYTTETITESTYGLTGFQSNTVTVEWYNRPPVASFTYSPEFPITDETVTFNASTSYDPDGTVTVYKWDFGDGTNGTGEIVTHAYADNRTYAVTLTVTDNEYLPNSTSKDITVLNRAPIAVFTESAETVYTNETITFDASASYDPDGTIVSYFWDFGDGDNATGVTAEHAYAQNGTFIVTLTVTDDDGASASASATKFVGNRPPVAIFTESAETVYTSESIEFNATESYDLDGSVVGYFWDFGDGTNTTGVIVEHAYVDDGNYTVTLTVTDDDGATNSTSAIKIVLNRPPIVMFTESAETVYTGETISFNASSSYDPDGTIVSYFWDFGDGAKAMGIVVEHAYLDDGSYNVTLTVTDDDGATNSTSSVKTVLNRLPIASFDYYPKFPIVGETVTFNASASYDTDGMIAIYKWDFGDGTAIQTSPVPIIMHTYTTRGNNTVTLIVVDDDDSENETVVTIMVIDFPAADFTYSPGYPIAGEVVTFDASNSTPNGGTIVSYFWDFGDGTTDNVTSTTVTHTYSSFGNYTVVLTVKDSEGLTNSTSKVITIIDFPAADFTYSPGYPIAGEVVTFDASNSTPNGGTIVSYFWDFGDGTNSTGLITSHIYSAFGTYVVTLQVVDSEQLVNSTSKLINVRQRPTANFTYSPELPMISETVSFDASFSEPNGGTIITYAWDFGDDQTGAGIMINHTYSTYGIHKLTLTVTDSEGLSNTFTQTIRIIIGPVADFMYAPTYPIINQSVLFDASISHDPDGTVITYTWDFGDGNMTTVGDPSIQHAFKNATMYDVTLTVTDNDGLTGAVTKRIIVYTTAVPVHDVAIVSVEPESWWVYHDRFLNITVTVTNEGTDIETFNVSLYYNMTTIGTCTVVNLFPGENLNLTLCWNTTDVYPTQYIISAIASIVPEETDTADNTLVYGTISVLWLGDINHDGKVDMRDIAVIARSFGSHVGEPRYKPEIDLYYDGKIDMRDIAPAARNYGQPHHP